MCGPINVAQDLTVRFCAYFKMKDELVVLPRNVSQKALQALEGVQSHMLSTDISQLCVTES
jgi:hypothetical protein